MSTSRPSTFVTLFALFTITNAVSLSNFAPYARDLTASCLRLYNAPIRGCSPFDFDRASPSYTGCGQSCIKALVQLSSEVYTDCGGSGEAQNHNGIIGAFLDGDGISDLCPNVIVTTATPGGSSGVGGIGGHMTTATILPSGAVPHGTTTAGTSVPTSGLVVDTSKPPPLPSTRIGGLPPSNYYSSTSMSHVTALSSTTTTSFATAPSPSSKLSTATSAAPSAEGSSSSHCMKNGGTLFSSCENGAGSLSQTQSIVSVLALCLTLGIMLS